jgi:hypothetical protein
LLVFCDTNTAIYDTHLLRRRGGLQLVRLLRALPAKLVLPEIVKTEYLSHFAKVSETTHSSAQTALSTLQTLCGYRLVDLLPANRFWEQQAVQILVEMQDVILEIPSTLELKAAALDRSVRGARPASQPNQDVKDCLIWECILSLPHGSEVIFVSKDLKAFFRDGEFDPDLAKEAEAKGLRLIVVNTSKTQNVNEVVELLKARIGDVESLRLGELRLDDHPLVAGGGTAVDPLVEPALRPVLVDAGDAEAAPEEAGGLEDALHMLSDQFGPLEKMAFGFVSYLKRSGKRQIVDLLVQAGANADAARNVLERLALAGLIRDTGNNYLASDGRAAEKAAELMEPEMIRLMGLGE